MNTRASFVNRILSVVGVLAVGVVLSILPTAFGWTNPSGNPPTGSGAVGVTGGRAWVGPTGTTASGTTMLTVNGSVSLLNNVISDVNDPVGGKDAANKNYVDSQVSGGNLWTLSGSRLYSTGAASQVGIRTAAPSTTLTVNGDVSVSNNRIKNLLDPLDNNDAVNMGYLQNQISSHGGGPSYWVKSGTTLSPINSITAVGINTATPTSPLTVAGQVDVTGNLIRNVAAGVNPTDAVNLSQVNALIAAGSGGGSMVIYFRKTGPGATGPLTSSDPQCPSGWTSAYDGFGPHFLGLLNYGYLHLNGDGSYSTGGFNEGGGATQGVNAYTLNSAAIGGDSVCSQAQRSIVNFSQIYTNLITNDFTSMNANACFTNPSTGVTECNRCIVCKK